MWLETERSTTPSGVRGSMSARKKKWIIAVGLGLLIAGGSLAGMAIWFAKRFEPYIREQAVEYLRKRFRSEVELASLNVRLPKTSPVRLLLTKGRGVIASVEGEGLTLRQRGRRDTPPMFAMKKFSFRIDLGALFDTPKVVPQVMLEGMEITVPPKGNRPDLGGGESKETDTKTSVILNEILIRDARLTILPKDKNKLPLEFEIHRVRLESAGADVAMKYDATLTNAKPPGEIQSNGTFGPWDAVEPGDTALAGEYRFEKADLSVFAGIAGTLRSTGRFA